MYIVIERENLGKINISKHKELDKAVEKIKRVRLQGSEAILTEEWELEFEFTVKPKMPTR